MHIGWLAEGSCHTSDFYFCRLFVRWGDEIMLLQVFLQSGQQPGLQSPGGQSSLLLRGWLQYEQLCLPSAKTQLPAAVSASVVPQFFQVDSNSRCQQESIYNTNDNSCSHLLQKCQITLPDLTLYTLNYNSSLLWFTSMHLNRSLYIRETLYMEELEVLTMWIIHTSLDWLH